MAGQSFGQAYEAALLRFGIKKTTNNWAQSKNCWFKKVGVRPKSETEIYSV
jgi:hypothetical protein